MIPERIGIKIWDFEAVEPAAKKGLGLDWRSPRESFRPIEV